MGDSGAESGFVDRKRALTGGVVGAAIAFLGLVGVGQVSDAKALGLLEATLPTIRFLAASIMGAAATILALMLTMLGVTQSSDTQFDVVHYKRIHIISNLSTVAIIGALVVLMFVGIPIRETDDVPGVGYRVVYYTILVAMAVLGGMLISVVLMLHRAIGGFIALFHPEMESHLLPEEEQPTEQSH